MAVKPETSARRGKPMDFYCARLLYIILVDDGRPRKKNHYDDSVIVFRARDSEHAFERALELGRAHEVTYKNHKNQDVRCALVKVKELKWLGKRIDGEEVFSELYDRVSGEPIPFDARFEPEGSEPLQF